MKNLIKRNKKWRKEYKLLELNSIINKTLIKNKINNSKSLSISKIKNLCILTGRSKALIRDYKISRIIFKNLSEAGNIPGIRKL